MRRYALALGVVAASVLAGAGLTFALDVLDGSAHPSVGHMFAQQSDPNTCSAEVIAGCSATLISPTVAVTSGGCAEAFANAAEYGYNLTATWISFNGSDPFDCATASRVDSLHFHPSFDPAVPGTSVDIGVAVLTAPAAAIPAALPAAGAQSGLVRGTPFDSVGWAPDANANYLTLRRRVGPVELRSGDADFLIVRSVQQGNVCAAGLDGGGIFEPGGQNMAGLRNQGSKGCKNASFLRLDTATSRDFLDDYVTLP